MREAGTKRFKQYGTNAGHVLPIVAKGIEIALRDADAQVAVDVLEVLRLGAVDVALEVVVVVVLRVGDFGDRHHAGITRVAFILLGKRIHDLVKVLLPEAVFGAVFLETLGGMNHEDAPARGGVFLVKHEDAACDAGAEKEIGRQADDGIEIARGDQLLPDDDLGIAHEQDSVLDDARPFAVLFRERIICSK